MDSELSGALTFKQLGWYLNSSAWFMKHILFEQKKIKFEINGILWKVKTDIMQHVLKMQ